MVPSVAISRWERNTCLTEWWVKRYRMGHAASPALHGIGASRDRRAIFLAAARCVRRRNAFRRYERMDVQNRKMPLSATACGTPIEWCALPMMAMNSAQIRTVCWGGGRRCRLPRCVKRPSHITQEITCRKCVAGAVSTAILNRNGYRTVY